jgi:hypothetical protein
MSTVNVCFTSVGIFSQYRVMHQSAQLKLKEIGPGSEAGIEQSEDWADGGALIERKMVELGRKPVIRWRWLSEGSSNYPDAMRLSQMRDNKRGR